MKARSSCPFIPPQSFSRKITMRRVGFLRFFTALTLSLSLAGPQTRAGSPAHEGAGPIAPHFSDAEKADLKRISAYLNTIKSVQGRFLQVGGDGRQEQGNFYLKKPGRVRFEYQKPNPNLIIAESHRRGAECGSAHHRSLSAGQFAAAATAQRQYRPQQRFARCGRQA
jgi:hypothetical protein